MDTKHLITFVTFAHEKSYLKASYKLNYAPSTLSEHILSLENELGVKLIESHGKRSVLTRAGNQFLPYAKQMLDFWKAAKNTMSSLNAVKGELHIMTVESLGLYRMSTVFARFMSQYPDVTLSISIGNCDEIYERLKQDQIDMAYLYDMEPIQRPDMNTTVLFKEDLCFVVSPTHPLAKKKGLLPSDFRLQTFILAQKDCYYSSHFTQMLADNDVHIKNKLELDSGNLIKKYVCSGYGITLLPSSVIAEDIQKGALVPLDWAGPRWEAYAQILTLKKDWTLPCVEKLIDTSLEFI